ncbi:MAG: DNA topoisomerase I, partial [Bacteroidetes bacterium CG_4_8_14_3_um_filter_31_14]
PRKLGLYKDKEIVANIGRFGPYAMHDGKFYSLKKGIDDPYTIVLDRAIELIIEKQNQVANSCLKAFKEDANLKIVKGRYGAYIKFNDLNYRIPPNTDWNTLTYKDVDEIIKQSPEKKPKITKTKTVPKNAKTTKKVNKKK